LLPAFTPFTFHWYAGGVPPFVGVAVKVTEPPIQKGFDEAEMEILTVRLGLTTIVKGMLDAGLPDVQVSEDVSVQMMTSLFKGM
jgi:hypothetical protein